MFLHLFTPPAFSMALNVPGVIVVILFYILVLGTGLFVAWKAKKVDNGGGDRQEALLLGNRKIDWLVGILTMTGNPSETPSL